MNDPKLLEKVKEIAFYYTNGEELQKAIEEAQEFIDAAKEFQQAKTAKNFLHLLEERVDVGIVLNALDAQWDENEHLAAVYDYKLARQLARISAETIADRFEMILSKLEND